MSGAVARRPDKKATASATRIRMEAKRLRVWRISRQKSLLMARMTLLLS